MGQQSGPLAVLIRAGGKVAAVPVRAGKAVVTKLRPGGIRSDDQGQGGGGAGKIAVDGQGGGGAGKITVDGQGGGGAGAQG